ncbi:hypothetical protein EDD11_003970 [Mortierella claussenii]|nr:hypothetical protein EDD11_003970 [Mortierella claussenii]
MAIHKPTTLQRSFIPPILSKKDVLIRDTTGSGKTFGVLLSLLSKPRRRFGIKGQPGITSVIVVPNQELALQLQSWTESLFPSATEQQLKELIQVIVTPSVSNWEMSTIPSHTKSVEAQAAAQIDSLARTLPHVLVATPTRLWDLIEKGVLDLSVIETLMLDEVDHLIRLPKRFASRREIENRNRHPKPAELAVQEIMRSVEARRGQEGVSDKVQVIAASATMNRPMRYWLETNGWIKDAEWIDTTKSVVLPESIQHHCVVVGSTTIRNMKLQSDRSPWDMKAEQQKDKRPQEKNAEDVDWQETDRVWQKEDKDHTWKERQLSVSGMESLEAAKFMDNDDRLLESVAMACMLDNVRSACVFFCSSFSLQDLANRFEVQFGLSVKQINDAFDGGQHKQQRRQRSLSTAQSKKESKSGIFIAHENNARGLDLPGLSHVFIVGLPSAPSSYVHMAGRTGRMGQKGQVLTIIRDDGHLEDRARSLFRTLNVDIKPFQHVE